MSSRVPTGVSLILAAVQQVRAPKDCLCANSKQPKRFGVGYDSLSVGLHASSAVEARRFNVFKYYLPQRGCDSYRSSFYIVGDRARLPVVFPQLQFF